jgi:Domain of unknown function (DUF4350)
MHSLPKNRLLWIALVAIGLFCLLLFLLAPASSKNMSGSTYNQAPDGYLGWYEYMNTQGTPLQQWRRPPEELLNQQTPKTQPKPNDNKGSSTKAPAKTLIQIYPNASGNSENWILSAEWAGDWLNAGNRLIILGVEADITEATFESDQRSEQGKVTVHTRRRKKDLIEKKKLLGDKYGAVVWQQKQETGQVILSSTPHVAANAYQAKPGNYKFLAQLATESGGNIWVDEYLHGFKETDVLVKEAVNSWSSYLLQTPVLIALVQAGVLALAFVLAQNQRLGTYAKLKNKVVDNSLAYIQALAAVLLKAESYPFVMDIIAKAERQGLQKALGFGDKPIEPEVLMKAWTQKTGQSGNQLTPMLTPPKLGKQNREQSFVAWLMQLRQLREQVK